jgi:phosphotransferase system  glucose/maltose/N-acetylglucosamine-specific IIC component
MARLGGADGVAWSSMFGLRQGTMRDVMSLLSAHTPETIPFYTPIGKLLFAIYYFSTFYFLFNKQARRDGLEGWVMIYQIVNNKMTIGN